MSSAGWIWMIVGALLVLSEFFITGIIAIFFGAGAILTGVAIAMGLVPSLAEQLILFAVLSVASLVFAREKIKVWFHGHVSDAWAGDQDLISARGSRVTVTRTFKDGVGRVKLSGTDWNAEAQDPQASYAEGATVWVIGHRGITLHVTDQRPEL